MLFIGPTGNWVWAVRGSAEIEKSKMQAGCGMAG
jgi:hypothetical protein